MLQDLQVKNFAIIDSVQISFKEGFNVISGETGAGKSILLKSLSLLMGGKATQDMIRSGAEQAVIEGMFDISKRTDIQEKLVSLGIESDNKDLIVKRIFQANGKGKVFINSSLCTLNDLVELVSPLVEITSDSAPLIEMTSQHESKSLLSKSYHQQLLDRYAMCVPTRSEYQALYTQYNEIEAKILQIKSDAETQKQQLDFLVYQRNEIQKLSLKENEEQELESSYNRVKHSAKLKEVISSYAALLTDDEDSVVARLKRALQLGSEIKKYDQNLFEKLDLLRQALDLSDEFSYQLQSYQKDIDTEDLDMGKIEERLSDLRKLQKKYGPSISDILLHLQKIEEQIHQIENHDDILSDLDLQKIKLQTQMQQLANKLHKTRANAAKLLQDGVNDELKDLNMKGLTFEVRLQKLSELNINGFDDIEFLCRVGKNTEPRSLAKTASGGELSRILLALKNVIGSSDLSRTYLFDEVDTGVSGETAEKVGRKLRQISIGQQVICITHLPQVACFADAHFYIEKDPSPKLVKMNVLELATKDRVQEIARLISGEKITKTSIAHAKELLTEANH
jgi:DNA repair protein RecN (Recombination protein N)